MSSYKVRVEILLFSFYTESKILSYLAIKVF